jgi:hypothetical protein
VPDPAVSALGLALTAAGLVAISTPRQRSGPLVATLLLTAPVAALLLKDDVRVYSFHGFLHTAIVYRILEGGVPPTDPLLGGEPLLYPWAHHLVAAGMVRLLGLSPATAFALLNLAALGLSAWLAWRIARLLGLEPEASLLAATLTLYGVSAFAGGPLAWGLEALGVPLESRFVPILKFTNVQSNGVGIACFLAGLHGLVRLAERPRPAAGAVLEIFLATTAAAFLYPLVWAPWVACALASVVWLLARGRLPARAALAVASSLGLAILVALPYLLAIQTGRDPRAAGGLEWPWAHHGRKLATLLGIVISLAPVLALGRRALRGSLATRRAGWTVLGVVGGLGVALFLGTDVPLLSEYKFLALATAAAGFPAGLALHSLGSRRPALAAVMLFLLLLPAGSFFAQQLLARPGDMQLVAEEGTDLVPTRPEERALREWILGHTSPDALFVDDRLLLPVFARRSLYVALDPGGPPEARMRAIAGWSMLPSVILSYVVGHDAEKVDARQALARALLGAGPEPADGVVDALREAGAPVYVVVRRAGLARRFEGDARFRRVFRRGSTAVYQVVARGRGTVG